MKALAHYATCKPSAEVTSENYMQALTQWPPHRLLFTWIVLLEARHQGKFQPDAVVQKCRVKTTLERSASQSTIFQENEVSGVNKVW